ncbi:MAG TPA: 1,4-alpha-glucan branching protein GlgB [Candidatus Baltobacteraceae bacterium]|nr:1,4-alpha-glucan branching protein GlgB [Candidatus Baltobacteraceae bacterium]
MHAKTDPRIFGELDAYLFAQGTHRRLYEKLGAHPMVVDGSPGVAFAVWAPNASRVAVVGDFNGWDGTLNPMRRGAAGVWEVFVAGVPLGTRYKYELHDAHGTLLPHKADPYAFACERPPMTASVVALPGKRAWNDAAWMARRAETQRYDAPTAIYEVHLGSWKRGPANRYLTYDELADELIPYAVSLGFTHLELMPVAEHPFDGSWGYQPIGLFAPTSRFGTPEQFANFVDRAHQAGLGVIVDWVPGHFPNDAHGLARFDGTALYEHPDPRRGYQPDWNTFVYDFGRGEVANFLLASALFWLLEYHVDALRVDAVASMLYLDYSRRCGEWVPNVHGGRENLEAIALLRAVNTVASEEAPGITTFAEESTAWPNVSRPVAAGGLGFGYKWNMGWMHDSLAYMHEDPLYRKFHQDQLTFSFMYAFSENFVLPLSHDEVVYGKGSLLNKMPGDEWRRFANLRAFLGYTYAHPGKKLLFMGGEIAQEREWNHDGQLDWDALRSPRHRGVQSLVRALNALHREQRALHELDTDERGIEWIVTDKDLCVVAFARRGRDDDAVVVAVSNFTPVVRDAYRLGVPRAGTYAELLNTDDARFGGSGVGNAALTAEAVEANGKAWSVVLRLPPLATVMLAPRR